MTLEACYRQMNADYEDILQRLGNEGFIRKILCKFPQDSTFSQLRNAIRDFQGEDAFQAAHTLKGISQNLGFTTLYERSAELTEWLRVTRSIDEKTVNLFEQVHQEYEKVIAAIGAFCEKMA